MEIGFVEIVSKRSYLSHCFCKIVSKLMLLFLIHLRFLPCVAQSKDCTNSYIAHTGIEVCLLFNILASIDPGPLSYACPDTEECGGKRRKRERAWTTTI